MNHFAAEFGDARGRRRYGAWGINTIEVVCRGQYRSSSDCLTYVRLDKYFRSHRFGYKRSDAGAWNENPRAYI